MKTNYFTKVENKYVFNLSLIFWHVFIALSTLTIAISLVLFLWSAIPAVHKKVTKQPYPQKKEYPAPVKIALSDLNLEEIKKEEVPAIKQEEYTKPEPPPEKLPVEDLTAKYEFEKYMDTLKALIPPSKYSWKGSGYWTYPQGERYWKVYQKEIYRRWIITESGIEDKLNTSFNKSNTKKYPEKKMLLNGYISIVKILPEDKRLFALQFLMENVATNLTQNVNTYQSLTNVVNELKNAENITYINLLSNFGARNPNDGVPLIEYIASIIINFDITQSSNLIKYFINAYIHFFDQNLTKQEEATNLYLPLVSQIKVEQQAKAIFQYYRLFLQKNSQREKQIDQIEYEHSREISKIESKFLADQRDSQDVFDAKKEVKEKLNDFSLVGIGGGILLIVFIATFLAFLSIQRSVRKMEEKMDK